MFSSNDFSSIKIIQLFLSGVSLDVKSEFGIWLYFEPSGGINV